MCQKFECFLYLIQIFDFHQRPVLSCAFQDPIHVWSGCLDGKLKSFDINSNQESVIGMHENTIRCIEFSNEINAVSDLCLVLLQVPKCFGLVQIFCARPKIYLHIVAVTNISCQTKR